MGSKYGMVTVPTTPGGRDLKKEHSLGCTWVKGTQWGQEQRCVCVRVSLFRAQLGRGRGGVVALGWYTCLFLPEPDFATCPH